MPNTKKNLSASKITDDAVSEMSDDALTAELQEISQLRDALNVRATEIAEEQNTRVAIARVHTAMEGVPDKKKKHVLGVAGIESAAKIGTPSSKK